MLTLETPLIYLKGVGSNNAKKLAKLGLLSVKDLLFYFPRKYLDFSSLKSISQLSIGEPATIRAKVSSLSTERSFKKRIFYTQAILSDESGSIGAVWFSKPYLEKMLLPQKEYFFAGTPATGKYGLSLIEPEYEEISEKRRIHTLALVPVYKEGTGVSSRYLRSLVRQILPLANSLREFLPDYFLKKYDLPDIGRSVKSLHFPKSLGETKNARRRFDLENLLLLEVFLLRRKEKLKKNQAFRIAYAKGKVLDFLRGLPFKLTKGQKSALKEILEDLMGPYPMNRLLQGDVGSGKTVVALVACLDTALAGYQSAFMAPTEILAWQQFYNAREFLKEADISLALWTSSFSRLAWKGQVSSPKRRDLLEEISRGNVSIVFGTHSLIQEKVRFSNLALVVVDEQHRFGVTQKEELAGKGKFPHILSMSATPIPRSLALSLYSDLDFSLIRETPKERKVVTKVVSRKGQKKVFAFIRREVEENSQAFVICPLIENSEKLEAKSVKEEAEKLRDFFPESWLAVIHGKLKAEEKERILEDFREGKSKILVSTSVIEVGIDIPRANILVVESPERFGLAQLYQLRGRIGRAGQDGYCFLFPEKLGLSVRRRLKAFKEAKDGFELAQKDLEIRGPGEFVGEKQSGWSDDLMKAVLKVPLVKIAREEALNILGKDSNLEKFPLLREKVKEFGERVFSEE